MRSAAFLILGLLPLLPAPALGQGMPSLVGCTHTLTVQSLACSVEHHYACQSPAGMRLRLRYDLSGLAGFATIDADAQWLESGNLRDGFRSRVILPATDTMSVSNLLATGYDSYAFDEIEGEGNRVSIDGWDRLTGQSVTIDGVPLLRTEFAFRIRRADGSTALEVSGREFVSPELMRFFAGQRTYSVNGETSSEDASPVRFLREGDAGFTATVPLYGCDDAISLAPWLEEHA